jgi:hypothetical protein
MFGLASVSPCDGLYVVNVTDSLSTTSVFVLLITEYVRVVKTTLPSVCGKKIINKNKLFITRNLFQVAQPM